MLSVLMPILDVLAICMCMANPVRGGVVGFLIKESSPPLPKYMWPFEVSNSCWFNPVAGDVLLARRLIELETRSRMRRVLRSAGKLILFSRTLGLARALAPP